MTTLTSSDTGNLLVRASRLLTASVDYREALPAVLEIIEEILDTDLIIITVKFSGTDNNVLTLMRQPERDTSAGEDCRRILEQLSGGTETVPIHDSDAKRRNSWEKTGHSVISLPIVLDREIIGSIQACRSADHRESPENETVVLEIICSLIARNVRLDRLIDENRKLAEENHLLHHELRERSKPEILIGNSESIQSVYRMIEKVAGLKAPVLILGESGTGRKSAAAAIHYGGPRAAEPFMRFNCAALPENIIEDELFGHERQTGDGAIEVRKGRFELANGGTLFLDEVTDLPPRLQAKLLRVIQEGEIDRVGGSAPRKIDVRLIASATENSNALKGPGRVRADLFYRLNVFPVMLPPLRGRKTDIPLLVNHFIARHNAANGVSVTGVSAPALEMMLSHDWPGNIRELENCVERAVILAREGPIHLHHLPPELQTGGAADVPVCGNLEMQVDSFEQKVILEAMKNSRGSIPRTAASLGLTERKLRLRLQKYRINPREFKIKNREL